MTTEVGLLHSLITFVLQCQLLLLMQTLIKKNKVYTVCILELLIH